VSGFSILFGPVLSVFSLTQTFSSTDDTILLLQTVARDHIPIMPPSKPAMFSEVRGKEHASVPEPKDRPTVDEVLTEIENQEWYKKQIVYRRTFEAKVEQIGWWRKNLHLFPLVTSLISLSEITGVLDPPLSDTILQALRDSRKISVLYTHQVAAINAVMQGRNVIVSTSTASGKSVIYQVRSSQM
jgi:DEAD/DEAH box helicase domain-containing protein